MSQDVTPQQRRARTPYEMSKEAHIYERGALVQMQAYALDEGDPYPGYFSNWVYEKNVQAVGIHGICQNDGTWDRNWLQGLATYFEGWAGSDPAVLTAGFQAMVDFYNTGNSMDANTIITDTSTNAVAQAAFVLTCPANTAYKVTVASLRNSTRAPTGGMVYTPNGGAAATSTSNVATTLGMTLLMLGGSGGTGVTITAGIAGPLWMQAGDTLELNCTNFVAADVMLHVFIFEVYNL